MIFSTALARMRLAGRLCRLTAWLILLMGLAASIYLSFFVINGPNNQASLDPRQVLLSSAIAILIAIPVFFFFVFLFAVGAFLDYMSLRQDTQHTQVKDEDRVEITALPRSR